MCNFGIQVEPYPGYDWYVDSVRGNDANTGASSAQAFATISALSGKITPGVKIGLARGSTWKERLNLNQAGAEARAYGTGNAPIFDCSESIAAGDWAKTEGQTNVYECVKSPALQVANTWLNIWEDDVFMRRVDSLANCDATPGSYYPTSDTTAPVTIYVHASGSGNPATNGKIYEYAHRFDGVQLNAENCILDGVRVKKFLSNGGGIPVFSTGCSLLNCAADEAPKQSYECIDGTYLENCSAHNSYYGVNNNLTQNAISFYTGPGVGERGFTCVNCSVTMDTYNTNQQGFGGHANNGLSVGVITLTNCSVTRCGAFFVGADYDELNIVGGSAVVCGEVCRCNIAGAVYNISGITQTGGTATSWDYFSTITQACTVNISNVISSVYQAQNALLRVQAAATLTVTGWTVTFNTGGRTFQRPIETTVGTATININNCDFNIGAGETSALWYIVTAGNVLNSDFNTFSTNRRWIIGGVTYNTLAEYQAGTGQDANSTIG